MKALCVSCLHGEGDPHRGGLCTSCAPFAPVRRHRMSLVVRHVHREAP
jgi:hypothetical protein